MTLVILQTEIVLIRLLTEVTSASKSGKFVLLALLDGSVAFDTVDDDWLIERLDTMYNTCGLQDLAYTIQLSYIQSSEVPLTYV